MRQVGQEVTRLSAAVASAGRGFGGGLAVGVSAVADAMRIVEGVAQTAGRAIGFVGDQLRAGFAENASLERATLQLQLFTGSAEEARRIVDLLRREADITPFSTEELLRAGAALSSVARAANTDLLALVRTAEALAAAQPEQGFEGAVFALREAVLGGDFQSIIDRFNLSRTTLNRLREQGVPALQAVQQAMLEVGATREQVEAFGRSFPGLASTLQSFGAELRRLATADAYRAVGQALGHLVALVNQYGDQLRAAAQAIGQVFTVLARRVVVGLAPLLAVLDRVLPGVGAAIREEFTRPIEDATEATRGLAPALQEVQQTDLQRVTRRLADVGVAAAQLQIDAGRLRRGYEDQLRPLERQRDLLRDSADLQRVQNALATNRATTERLRLEREVGALSRAARGREDPDAPDLTPRQRAIALALQERRLRLEELGLTEQQRPALQAVEGQIDAIRRQQADALAPIERSLELRREEVALLQLERERLQAAAEQAKETAGQFGAVHTAMGGAPPEVHDANKKSIGEQADELAKEWLDRWDKYVQANGGNAWTAIAASLTEWTITVGIPVAIQVGREIANGIIIGLRRVLGIVEGSDPALDWLKAAVERARTQTPPTLSPEEAARVGQGGGPTTVVEVAPGAVQVDGMGDPAQSSRLRAFLRAALEAYSQGLAVSAATTDPGASARQQGSGRAP